jgi:hypothetical protein
MWREVQPAVGCWKMSPIYVAETEWTTIMSNLGILKVQPLSAD